MIDSYRVRDYDHDGEVPEFRQQEVARLIRQVLRGETRCRQAVSVAQPLFAECGARPGVEPADAGVIDNETSDKYTILDVFAHDRPGLLYRIARTLFEWQMSVTLAKIFHAL